MKSHKPRRSKRSAEKPISGTKTSGSRKKAAPPILAKDSRSQTTRSKQSRFEKRTTQESFSKEFSRKESSLKEPSHQDSRDFELRDGGNREDRNRDDLIYGRHTVMAAMEHQRPLNRIWVVPQLRQNRRMHELLMDCKSRGVVIDEVNSQRLDQLTSYATHQGVAAQVGACDYLDLAALTEKAIAQTTAPVLVAVDGVTDPHNLGAIIRSAEAMGTQGLILPQRRCASVGSTVAKVAAGALESLPIARVINLNQALETLKESGFWIYGLTLDAGIEIQSIDLQGSVVLVIGSEGKGLSAVTQKHCDSTVKIPLLGSIQSLNASVAAGIGLYEISRQRQSRGSE